MKIPGWSITILISILTAAVLELNKNTLLGWLLFALAFVGMVIIGSKYMGSWKWWKRGLGILAYLLVCAGRGGLVFLRICLSVQASFSSPGRRSDKCRQQTWR